MLKTELAGVQVDLIFLFPTLSVAYNCIMKKLPNKHLLLPVNSLSSPFQVLYLKDLDVIIV